MKNIPVISMVKNNALESIIGGIVLLVVIMYLIKKIGNSLASGASALGGILVNDNNREFAEMKKKELDKVSVKSSNLLMDETFYISWVNRLYEAMQGAQIGRRFTKETIQELGTLNADELKHIAQLFGVRQKNFFPDGYLFWTVRKIEDIAGADVVGTLFDWFDDELRDSEKTEMKNVWRKTALWA